VAEGRLSSFGINVLRDFLCFDDKNVLVMSL
jgi:hypothetical protein